MIGSTWKGRRFEAAGGSEPELVSGSKRARTSIGLHLPAPVDQGASDREQGRSVLEHHRWRTDRARNDGGALSQALRPLLDPRAHHLRVLDLHLSAYAAQERALARLAVDREDVRARQGDGEWEAGESGAGPDVRDALRLPELRHLEPRERVGDVEVHGLRRAANRARSVFVGPQLVDDRRELLALPGVECVVLGELAKARRPGRCT